MARPERDLIFLQGSLLHRQAPVKAALCTAADKFNKVSVFCAQSYVFSRTLCFHAQYFQMHLSCVQDLAQNSFPIANVTWSHRRFTRKSRGIVPKLLTTLGTRYCQVYRSTSLTRNSAPQDPTAGLCIAPYGGPKG